MLRKINRDEKKLSKDVMTRILGGKCIFACGCGDGVNGSCGSSTTSNALYSQSSNNTQGSLG